MSAKRRTTATSKPLNLPSPSQIQFLACKMLEDRLESAIQHACEPGIWRDEWQAHVNAADLVREGVQRLKAALPLDFDEFSFMHARIQSTIALVAAAFPDKDTAAWRNLHAAETGFTEVLEALELAEQVDEGARGDQ